MGLDMYLEAERFIGSFSDTEEKLRDEVLSFVNDKMVSTPVPSTEYSPVKIAVEVAYWRKANAIHNWFVKNVQKGVDECQRTYVFESDLRNLLDACEKALLAKENEDLDPFDYLPPVDGFFFGNTFLDEYYWDNVERTAERIQLILDWLEKEEAIKNYWAIYYQSSW